MNKRFLFCSMLKRLFAQSKQSLFLLLYFSLMPALFGSSLAGYCLAHSGEIQNMGLFPLFMCNILASFGLGLGLMPTTFYSLLGGYLFGWSCLPFLIISYFIASAFGYWFCSFFDKGKLMSLLNEKYSIESFLDKLSGSGIQLAALCRMSPALPFAILNAIFSMVQFPFTKYMVGSIIGMVPRTVLAVYIGSLFTNVHSISDLKSDFTTWFALFSTIISFVGIGWIVKNKLSMNLKPKYEKGN